MIIKESGFYGISPHPTDNINSPTNQIPTAVVYLNGGCIEGVISNIPGLEVHFLDYDTDGIDQDDPNLMDLSEEEDKTDLQYMSTHVTNDIMSDTEYQHIKELEAKRMARHEVIEKENNNEQV